MRGSVYREIVSDLSIHSTKIPFWIIARSCKDDTSHVKILRIDLNRSSIPFFPLHVFKYKQMKHLFQTVTLTLIVAGFLFYSCKKDRPCESCQTNQPANNSTVDVSADVLVDVYVAGSEWNGTKSIAKYWKNGTSVSLTDGNNNALATAIAISGSDIHVIGYEIIGNITIAQYWKNGIPVFLTNGYSRATAIAIYGNDVYVAGYEYTGNGSVANKFWKNGTPITLTGNPPAAAIAISGNDIYVAGNENDGNEYSYIDEMGNTATANYSVIKYWKNGTPLTLSNGSNNAYATDIAISGNDVYVVGLEQIGNDRVTKYWKNGVPVTLTNSGSIENGIAISGSDVYVAGSGSHGYGVVAAKYWKNGTPVILPTNGREPHATDIAIFRNDVYVAGFDYDYGRTNTSVAKYWKNGVAVPLTNGTFFASAYSIVVVPR